jgi:hypothetical protein
LLAKGISVVVIVLNNVVFVGWFEGDIEVTASVVRLVSLRIVKVVTNVNNSETVDVTDLTANVVCFSVLSLEEVEDVDLCVGTEDGKISTWVAEEKLLVVLEVALGTNVVPLEKNVEIVFLIVDMLVSNTVDSFVVCIDAEDVDVMIWFEVAVLLTVVTWTSVVVMGKKSEVADVTVSVLIVSTSETNVFRLFVLFLDDINHVEGCVV